MELHLEQKIKDVKYLVLTNIGPAVSIGNNVYINEELVLENMDPVSIWYQSGVIWGYNKDNGISICSTETKQKSKLQIEKFAGSYPFIIEDSNNDFVNQNLYVLTDYVMRPVRDFKISKYNIWNQKIEGDSSFLNGYMVMHRSGKYFIEWPAGRNRDIRVVDTESQTELWKKAGEVDRSTTLVTIQDGKIFIQVNVNRNIFLEVYDLNTGQLINTKRLVYNDHTLAWPLKYDKLNNKLVMPFSEIDMTTLNISSKIQKYKDFIRSKETRYGYSGVNCFNSLFYAMSFYRDNPMNRDQALYELALFDRTTFDRIYTDHLEGFSNPVKELQCTNDKLFIRDGSGTLFIYDIEK